jgi:hypothetical protein
VDSLYEEFDSATLLDGQGTVLHADGQHSGSASDSTAEWDGHFTVLDANRLKSPIALRWNVVTQTREIGVPFSFRNLPLPPE